MNAPLIFLSEETGAGTAVPLGLEGAPVVNDAGETIHYRRLRVVPRPPQGQQWVDVKDGEVLDMQRSRLDRWIKNTNGLISAGRKPFVTKKHEFETPDPADTMGVVERLERDAEDQLYAVVGLHGDDNLKIAARNGRSIGVAKNNALDATGNIYSGEWMHHLAIVPNSALPGLERFAASADGKNAKVFALSTSGSTPERSPTMFKPETLEKLRTKFGANTRAEKLTDEQIGELIATVALAEPPKDQTAQVTALSADKTRLESELAKAKSDAQQATLALSAASPAKPDPEILRDRAENYVGKIANMVDRGDIPTFIADKLSAKLKPESTSVLMLSASSDFDNRRPIDFVLGLFDGAKLGIQPGGVPRQPAKSILELSGDATDPEKVKADAAAEATKWQESQLQSRGMTASA